MGNIWGRVQSFLTGAAISRASSDAVGPVMEPVRQRSFQKNAVKVLDPGTLAEALAKFVVDEKEAQPEALRSGVNSNRLEALTLLAQSWPGLGELDRLSNRDLIGTSEVITALRRQGYPDELIGTVADPGPLVALFQDLLSVADVAAGVQQGHLKNEIAPDGDPILPNISPAVTPAEKQAQPTAPDGQPPSAVPLTEIDSISPIKEAAGQGYDVDRLRVRANLSGLPPGPAELLTLWNRNEITEEAVDAGLREGHLKTKWSGAYKRMRWAVLGASEYANAYVRAWITQDEMYEGGRLTGHTKAQMDLMYKNRGRPLAPVQAFTAWARGAPHPKIPGEPDRPGTFDFQDFDEALRRSDVQTWYAPVLWHNRYAYPPLFQLGRLAQAKALKRERVQTILRYERYEEEDIQALLDFWFAGTAAKENPYIGRAQTQLWTALHKAYVKDGSIDEATTDFLLREIIPDDGDRFVALSFWTTEKNIGAPPAPPA